MTALLITLTIALGYILGAIHTQRRLRAEIERKHAAIREECRSRMEHMVRMFQISQEVDAAIRKHCVTAARAAGRREAEYEAAQAERRKHVH
jgi:hypothetical protein